ncbi:MAG: FAD-dependent oxidoreductase, partial [Planctomycetota bacterium]|nr:FAD-dependent oxidoreductase [Planctomycetota bacterium]
IGDAEHAGSFGVAFEQPKVDVKKLRDWKNGVIRRLSTGIKGLLSNRKVDYITGRATFEDSRRARIEGGDVARIKFKHCIIATGSRAKMLPESLLPRELCWDAADALKVEEIPRRLLVIGGGYIGLELGQVYAALGSEVTILETLESLLPGADPDLVKPLLGKLRKQFKAILTGAALKGVKKKGAAVEVAFSHDGSDKRESFERILVSVGRQPNSDGIGIEKTQAEVDDMGFITVDAQRRTTDKRLFAIGDVACQPMLAHKAMREAKVAVEAIAGHPSAFDPACIPAVVYTDPELAWCGVTEPEALAQGLNVKVTKFPWTASGRAVSMGRTDGLTKMIFDAETQRLLGIGIVGVHAGDLISEGVLAIEMAAVAEDIGSSIHPHPATSETIAEAAEALFGRAVHVGH